MAREARVVDVAVIGGGPVGLVTAYQLARFGVSVAIVEKHAKSMQDTYGRAITLYPRSSEMLDQLGLADELAQQCFACRETVSYNANGEEVHGRGWNFMENMSDTHWDFALVLRQKYQEEIFRKALGKHGIRLEAPVELTAVDVDESLPVSQYRITATLKDGRTNENFTIRCRYLIGADGGRSSVRRMLDIPFHGSTTEDKWVRIDGKIKTNLPKPRTYCAIESPTHGNVLWAALDHGATRIGYAFTAERGRSYDVFDDAAAIREAIAAVKPFSLEFETVDWWTIYSVGQRIADSCFVKDCVFLAGDSFHTHSSGAAQGMNTGLHDAVNLAWKLGRVIRGQLRPEILHTYQTERLPNVEKLIKYDKDISRLMSSRLPEGWTGDTTADVHEILGRVLEEAGTFSSGLGIYYELQDGNPLNVTGSFTFGQGLFDVAPGKRAPDVSLLKPATFRPISLIAQTPNSACFYAVVFAGETESTSSSDRAFVGGVLKSQALDALQSEGILSFLTILASRAPSAYETLGHEPLGRICYDNRERSAHLRYGVDLTKGAVVLIRPDGWVATMAVLESHAVTEIEQYFQRIVPMIPGDKA